MFGGEPSTGAVRPSDADGVRYDLIPEVGLRRVAETMAEGLRKGYPPHDWRKGIKFSEHLNHILAHLNKFNAGDTSEDHVGHAIARLMMIADHEENMPGMDDRWKGDAK